MEIGRIYPSTVLRCVVTQAQHFTFISLTIYIQSCPKIDNGRVFYQGRLKTASEQKTAFQFTLKLRKGTGPWQWIRDVCALEDGEVFSRPTNPPSSDIDHYLGGLSEDCNIREVETASPGCICWELSKSLSAADGIHSAWDRATLGTPQSVSRWFALVRHNPAWFAPRQGRDAVMLNVDAILLSFLRKDGTHLILVAVSGFDDITCVFRADVPGLIVLVSRNDKESAGTAHLFAAVGPTWHTAVKTAMEATKGYVQQQTSCMEDPGAYPVLTPEEEQELTCWYDGLTYCTWNGLGQDLTPAKILEALDTLKGNDIHVDTLLIDDNWQSLDFAGADNFYYAWTGFEANTEHFPSGLKDLISTIRKSHPCISDIAVWHGIFGYWGGMSQDGQLARDYLMRTFKRQEGIFLGGGDLTTVDGTAVGRLYDDFYRCSDSENNPRRENASLIGLQLPGGLGCNGSEDRYPEPAGLSPTRGRPLQSDITLPGCMASCDDEAFSWQNNNLHGTDPTNCLPYHDANGYAQAADEKLG